MTSQKTIKHYLDYYNDWFKALHNAKCIIDMAGAYQKGVIFMNILNELWDADLIAIAIVERYAIEISEANKKKLNTYYN